MNSENSARVTRREMRMFGRHEGFVKSTLASSKKVPNWAGELYRANLSNKSESDVVSEESGQQEAEQATA